MKNFTKLIFLSFLISITCTSAYATDAVLGKDGMIFLDEEGNAFNKSEIEKTVDSLNLTAAALNSIGIKTIFLIIPTKASIYPENVPQSLKLPGDFKTRYVDIQKSFAKSGLKSLDIKNFLINLKNIDGINIWMQRDSHWTPIAGYNLGKFVASYLLNLGWIEKLNSDIEINWSEKTYNTDLARIYKGKNPTSQIPLGETVLSPDMSIQTNDLLGGMDSSVVLVGSSYSMLPYPALHIGLSVGINSPAINFGMDGGGIWGGMQKFVSSQNFRDPSVKVVVWEIPERIFTQPEPEGGLQLLLSKITK